MQFRASSITPSIYKAGRLLAGLNIFSLRHDFPKKKKDQNASKYMIHFSPSSSCI